MVVKVDPAHCDIGTCCCLKRDLALKNGFKYLEIWSDDDFDHNIQKSIDFIKNLNI
jgi:hypothetical protein